MFRLFPVAISHVDEESEIYYIPDGQFVHDKNNINMQRLV